MKKVLLTYFALLLILSSLFSTPLSVLANTNTDSDNENSELEVTEEVVETQSEEAEEEPEVYEEPVEEVVEEEATEGTEEENVVPEETESTEESEEVTEEEEGTEENADAAEETEEEENESMMRPFAEVNENLLESFALTINYNEGDPDVVDNGDDLEIDVDNINHIQLVYGLIKPDDVVIAAGDTYTIDLPQIYRLVGSANNVPITIGNNTVGTYSINEGQAVVTFNENVNNYDDVLINVYIQGAFNTEIFEVQQEVVINVPFRDDTSYTATLRAEREDYDGTDQKVASSPYIIDESGERIETYHDPEFIDWTVRVNDSMIDLGNATVIDTLGENLEIVEGSFIVERIIRNLNNEETGSEVVDVTPIITESGFELNLGSIEDAYDITYTTSITRPDGGGTHTINNDASIILDGDSNNVSDEFTGTWSGDIPAVTKTGALLGERQDVINWTVEYNFGQETLGEVSLTDTLTHGEVDLSTVVVTPVETDIDGNVVSSGAPVELVPVQTENGMVIPGLDADGQAYLITFSSSVPVGLNENVINTITDDLEIPNSDSASVPVNTIPTGGKVGEQYVDENGAPYIEWTITMNSQNVDVSSINITDVFNPLLLNFDVNDTSLFELYREGEIVNNFGIEYYEHNDGRTGFTLGITDGGPYTYEFVYRTYYTVVGMQQPQLANNAELIFFDGDGNGIGDGVSVDFNLEGPLAGIDKTGTYISTSDNTEQEIEWTVTFNASNILLQEEAVLTDSFTSGNYELISNTLQVLDGDGNPIMPSAYTVADIPADTGFTIILHEATSETITVVYRTTTDDENNVNQVNEATLSWQGGHESVEATVDARNPGISKSGEVITHSDGTRTVNWTVDFNTNRNILHDVVISENLVPTTSVITDIVVSRDGTPLDTGAYTVNNPGADGASFTVEMDRLDAVPYQLTYTSSLSPSEEVQNVSNTVDISYTGGTQDAQSNIPSPELGVEKEAAGLDRETGVIDWRIRANTGLVNLVYAVLSDEIPVDQELIFDSIEVVRVDNQENITNTLTIAGDLNSFSIILPDGSFQYDVTFQTEILEFPAATPLSFYTNETTLNNANHDPVSDDAYIDYFEDGSNNNNTKTGEVNDETENIDWTATVNPLGLTINDAVITDALSYNQTYVEDSIVVTDESGALIPSDDYQLVVAEDNHSFTIVFLGDGQISQPINVSYSTRLNPNLIGFYTVSNDIILNGGQQGTELSRETVSTQTSQWSYGGGGVGRTVQFTIEKMHEDGEVPIPGATFEFTRITPTGTQAPLGGVITTGPDGTFFIDNARAGRYIVEEIETPEGYAGLSEPFYIIIGYADPALYPDQDFTVTLTDSNWTPITDSDIALVEGTELTVYNALETGSVSSTKEWVDAEDDYYPATWFQLYRNLDGEAPEPAPDADILQVNSDSPSETVTWDGLELTAPDLEPYIFTVLEVDAEGNDFTPPGFTKEEDGLTVTNTATFIEIDVTKEWVDADNLDGSRPATVNVQLLANGDPQGQTIELSEDNDWTYTFEDLREYSQGSPVEYTVVETDLPDGYSDSVVIEDTGDVTITNTRVTEVSVEKVWDDADNQDGIRPESITINLFADEAQTDIVELSAGNSWQYTFTDLPFYDGNTAIDYTVTEVAVDEYTIDQVETAENVYVITNTHEPYVRDAAVSKVWDDADNQDAIRPTSVQVQLTADGDPVGDPVTLDASNNWTNTWEDLDVNSAGEEIIYSVVELDADERYSPSVNNDDFDNIILTNSYEPETIEIAVSKVWDDADNQDGIRPANIEVNLIVGSEIISEVELSELNDWQYTFTDLPVNEDGVEIEYRITEDNVANYTATYSDPVETDEGSEVVITNTYTPDETSVRVTKVWNDSNNQDGNRPASVQVQLYGNGEEVGAPVTVTAAESWTYIWTGLDLNAGGTAIDYTVEEVDAPAGYTVSVDNFDNQNLTITNSYTPETIDIPVTKVWNDEDDQDGVRPNVVTFNLLADGEVARTAIVDADDNWSHTFTDLPLNDSGVAINYTVTENTVAEYSTVVEADLEVDNGFVVTNTHTPDETSATVTKSWNDANNQDGNRPESIEVQLSADGVEVGAPVEVTANDNWTYTWTGLDANADGEAIDYTVEEVNVNDDYTVTVSDADHGNMIITNSYTPALTEVPVTKVWDDADNQDGERPGQITLNLLNDRGEIVRSAVVQSQEDDEWTYTFTNIPAFENGTEIEYSVTENFVSDYSTSVEADSEVENGYVVTNSYTPEQTSVTVTKGWNDGNNQDGNRPEFVTVQLFADGEEVETPVNVTAADNWTYTWTGLALNEDGEPITYTVQEVDVEDGYTSIVNNNNQGNLIITNIYTPETIDIPVTKVWEDNDDQDGVRPNGVAINLLADGEIERTAVLNLNGGWEHTFTNLPVYENGVEINYTVTENTVAEYSTEVFTMPDVENEFQVVNTHTPDETSATVTKAWNDGNNQDGNRPESIEVQLFADGEAEGTVATVTAADNWTYTWTGLDANADGEPVDYTVEEVNASGDYVVTIDDTNHGNMIITNSYTPETVDIPVIKVWEDNDDQDGVRPSVVTINLLADGEVERTTIVSANGDWRYTFTDLPVNEAGTPIIYTVTENTVPEYSTEVFTIPDVQNEFFVVNTHTPDETSATVTKSWNDANNQDGNRPSSIEVQLFGNGEAIDSPVNVTAADNWTYTWTGLDLNANGEPVIYTVEEVDVAGGYTSVVNNNNQGNLIITNSYTPEMTEVPVLKVWDDADNQDGERPGNITLNLLNDRGEIVRQAVVTDQDSNEWSYTFTNIPRFENGTEIQYSVTENFVSDYSTSIEADDEVENGYVVTNSYTPEQTTATVTKGWNDANNQDGTRPELVTVQLFADGEELGLPVEVTAADNWTYTWTGLDLNANGEPVIYTVEELDVAEGYTSVVNNNDQGNLIITNSYTPALTEVPVTKVWDDADNQDGERPVQITLNLLNDRGEIVRSAVVQTQDDNEWTYTFTNIPAFENGTEIQYSVTENFVSDYSTSIEADDEVENGYVVTNSYTPEQTTASVTKGWNDVNNQDGNRPELVTVQLFADGEELGAPVEVTAADNWTYTWTGLDANANGEPVIYTVEEVDVADGYTSVVNNNNQGNLIITNSYTPALTEVPVTKVWDDADNQDGERPENITLNLLNDRGEIVRSAVVQTQDDNEWTYTFTNIPAFENGTEIQYSVTENFVSDYSTSIEADDEVENGYVVTNSYTPEQTTATVTKGWNDANNQDGNRPEFVTVQLFADGEEVETPVNVTAAEDWTYTWTGLDLNADGEPVDYTVEEVGANGDYAVTINDTNHGNMIITNNYTPEVTEVDVTKVWNDGDNQDAIRPNGVTINLLADGEVERTAVLNANGGWEHTFTNLPVFDNGNEINYTVTENTVQNYSVSITEESDNNFVVTNNYTPEETSATVTKAWNDANNQDGNRPASIEVQLFAGGEELGNPVEVTAADDWTYTWTGLALNDAGEPVDYTVEEVNLSDVYDVAVNDTNHGNMIITNSYTPEVTEVFVSKVWDDADNQDRIRPASVEVNLLDGSEIVSEVVLDETNNWQYTFTDLPVFSDGEEIQYRVTEDTVANYSPSIDMSETDDGYAAVITNSYTPEETTATVTKFWSDSNNQDGNRPELVTVQLFADGEELGAPVEVTSADNWTYTWTGLDLNANGEPVIYTVEEVDVAEGYTSVVNNNNQGNLIITNSYTPALTEVPVTKVWDDADNQDGERPGQITLNLLNDRGEIVRSAVVQTQDDNEWTYTFTNIPAFENGTEIQYSVTENFVSDYSTSIETDDEVENGYVVTNSYTPEQTTATVTKGWNDANNQDGNRPEFVTVQLFADGEEVETPVTVSAADNWTYTWTGLALNEDGEPITYTVQEVDVEDGYTSIVNNNNQGNLIITNIYTPETIDIPVTKVWNDGDDQDAIRPNAVTINLLADGEVERTAVLNANGGWEHTFTNLPVFDNGNVINYTVTENTVQNYSVSITEESDNNFVVTNNYTPEETSATVTKSWNDSNNQDGNRPASIEVQLFADSEELGNPVEVTAADDWTYTWTGLNANATGEPVDYTVEEVGANEDYTVTINDTNHGNMIITNSYTPEVTEVFVSKVWDDEDNQDGIRPPNVEVNLLDGSEIVSEVVLDETNNWQYTFTDLPVYSDGEEIQYRVTEDTVANYSPSIDMSVTDEGYAAVITNSYTPEETTATVTKFWSDNNDQDGNRPETITVQLFADEEELGNPVEVTEVGNWTYTWTGLDLNADGEPVTYTVEEVEVAEGYTSVVNNNNQGNLIITNSYTPETIDIPVTKVWVDNEDQDGVRPEQVTIHLLADGEVVRTTIVDADDNWSHTFTDLPVYEDGVEISYGVTENTVAEYSTLILASIEFNEFIVVNTHTPDQTSATVTKAWNDANNQDGNRPSDIQVQLFGNGETVGDPVTVTAADNWTYTWSGLAANADGEPIDYTVQEVNVSDEYDVAVNDTNHGNMIITNSYTPELTEVPVSKVWDDADNQDGERPGNITLNLLNDRGEIVRQAVVTDQDSNEWSYTFTNIPRFENGTEIAYSVTENFVSDYSTSIEVEEGVQVVTNSYTPEETSVTVTKGWNDANNQDGNRPDAVTVQLFADGQESGDPVEVTVEDNWSYTWTGLDLNADGEPVTYTVQEVDVAQGYTSTVNNTNQGNLIIVNSYTPELTEVPVTKVWDDADNQDGERPEQITLNLLNGSGEIVRQAVVFDQEGNEWTYTFTNLPMFENGAEIAYRVTENFVSDYSASYEVNDEGVQVVTNSYTPEETSVTVTKGWNDGNNQDGNRPDAVTVQLFADGEELGEPVEVTVDMDWTYTWTGLDLNADGEPIRYTVEELDVDESYTSTVNNNNHGNLVITNTYNPEVTQVNVTKVWDDADDQDRIRPGSITVNLYADNELIRTAIMDADSDWAHTFSNLPVYDDAELIEYRVTENDVESYTTEITEESDNNFVVTNSYTPLETTASVTKVWDDTDNQDGIRSETVEVQLTGNGEAVGEAVTLSEDNDWTYNWEGLALNDAGEAITYSVEEVNVPEGYASVIDDADKDNMVVTNSYTPLETEVNVTKVWDDADNQDGIRSESVEVQLTGNGEAIGEPVTLSEDNNWTFTWTELPLNSAGEAIAYTVVELDVPEGYTSVIEDEDHADIVVTNSYTPLETSATVTKVWDDADNQDGIRSESVDVQLTGDDENIGEPVTLSADNNWTYTWTELPVNDAGDAITYSVLEVNVPEDYTSEIDDADHGDMVVTNSYTPSTIDIPVAKVWDDADNQDGIRPVEVTVNVLNNEGEVVDEAVLSGENEWQYTFTDLPENAAGETINYRVTENTVESYSTEITESSLNNFTVTNTYTPEETSVTVTKGWVDDNNQDGYRPESVEVQLTADGESLGETVTLSADNNWTNTWNELPVNADGEAIAYSVVEVDVPQGYTSSVNDENHGNIIVTNSLDPRVSVGDYVWIDENRDGLQDETDTPLEGVELTITDADGNPVTDIFGNPVGPTTTDENGFYTFENLPIDNTYIVTINQEAFERDFPELSPTIEGAGDGTNDSSTWTATSVFLDEDGQRDPTLDFGFVRPVVPETTEVSVEKVWVHGENEENLPTSVVINLLDGEGTEVDSVTLDDSNDWQHTFTDLEMGQYTVSEEAVENYQASYETDGLGNFTVTNTFVVGEPGEPQDPSVPGEPEEPSEPSELEAPAEGEDPEDALPSTGIALSNTIAMIAGILLAIGAGLVVFTRRKNTVK